MKGENSITACALDVSVGQNMMASQETYFSGALDIDF